MSIDILSCLLQFRRYKNKGVLKMKKIKKIEITETTRKEHIKMWKSKKNWVCGAVVLFSSTVLLSVANENVKAAEVDNGSVAANVVAQEAQKSNGYQEGQLGSSIGQALAHRGETTTTSTTTIADTPNKSTEVSNAKAAADVVAQEAQKSNGYQEGQLGSSIGQALAHRASEMDNAMANTPNKSTEFSNALANNNHFGGSVVSGNTIANTPNKSTEFSDALANNSKNTDSDLSDKSKDTVDVVVSDLKPIKTVDSKATKVTADFASYKPAAAKVIATATEKATEVTPALVAASATTAETVKNEIPKFGSKENTALIAIGMVSVAGALTGLALEAESRKRRS